MYGFLQKNRRYYHAATDRHSGKEEDLRIMKIGIWELVVIFIVALIVIGPDKFPDFARKFGKGMRDFKNAAGEMTKEFRENITEPLEEAQKPLKEALEPVEELGKDLKNEVKDIEKTLNGIGRSGKTDTARSEAAEKSLSEEAEKSPSEAAGQSSSEDIRTVPLSETVQDPSVSTGSKESEPEKSTATTQEDTI